MIKISSLFVAVFCLVQVIDAQDTTVVQTFDYNSTTRDTVIQFPEGNESYRQILMLYNMRCKGARVSTGSNRNLGCGEWDYSCNTYITDSSRRDSFLSSTPRYAVSGYSGSSIDYTNQAIYDKYQMVEYRYNINSTNSETNYVVGSSQGFQPIWNKGRQKHLVVYTAAELQSAGLTAGEIDALSLNLQGSTLLKNVQIQMANVPSGAVSNHVNLVKQKVFQKSHIVLNGTNTFQFFKPFNWDGTSDVLIQMSHEGAINDVQYEYMDANPLQHIASKNDSLTYLNGNTYYEAAGYKGISGTNARSVDAWINTNAVNGEICSWGADRAGEKWVFRVNDNGTIRVEVNGGNVYGTTKVNDGKWHHVAFTFSGSQVSDIKLYVDGQLETVGAINNRAVNTASSVNVRISRGINNRYFTGHIDELRIWNAALSDAEVALASNLAFENDVRVQAHYQFGSNITKDASNFGRNLTRFGDLYTINQLGRTLVNGFQEWNHKPRITFIRGDYNASIDSSRLLVDSLMQVYHVYREVKIYPKYGAISNDSIATVSNFPIWNASNKSYTYNENGEAIDSANVSKTATANLSERLDYYRRFPSSLEIMSFVTPYGINLDLGPEGATWVFDVTDFTPILKGKKRMFMSRGGQWQEEMDIQFLFIKGTPEREVKNIVQLWPTSFVTANYNQILANKEYFPPIKYPVNSEDQFVVKSAITGHGQQGEFIPRVHTINVEGKTVDRQVWKECGNNPVYPQGGTWIYDRAGWCPGMATDFGIYPVQDLINGKDSITIDYTIEGGEGDSRYIINNQMVQYSPWKYQTDAAMSDIISPTSSIEHGRFNPLCVQPTIEIRNTGSDTLTNVKVKYWVNDENNAKTDVWHGSVAPGEYVRHTLPVEQSIWSTAKGSNDWFFAEVLEVNGKADVNTENNRAYSPFELPPVVPNEVVVFMRSNNAGNETSVKIIDDWGQVIYERKSLDNNTLYRDTVKLGSGCHQMVISDSDDDGINFWANNDGTGFIRLIKVGGGYNKTFQGDFGSDLIFNFTVNNALSVPKVQDAQEIVCYPNPAQDWMLVNGNEVDKAEAQVFNSLGQKVPVSCQLVNGELKLMIDHLAVGVYSLQLTWSDRVEVLHFQKSK